MRTHLFAAPLVGIALILAGCGGSDDKGLSKADYVTQADAICTKAAAQLDKDSQAAVQALGTDSPTDEQLATIAKDVAVPNLEKQLGDLKALDAPKDDKDTLDALYTDLDGAIAKVKADPTTLINSGDASATSPFASANEKAKAYGLKSCGDDS